MTWTIECFFISIPLHHAAKMRGGAGAAALRTTSEAVDFTAGFNVNSIVTRIPIAAFGTGGDKLDLWATVSLAMEVEDGS